MSNGADLALAAWADRVTWWLGQAQRPKPGGAGLLALQGWALREALRRAGVAGEDLMSKVAPRMDEPDLRDVSRLFEHAELSVDRLLAELDREAENFSAVRDAARETFFAVLDALIVADAAGGGEEQAAARRLFNRLAPELYALEPVADLAEFLKQPMHDRVGLSDLFVTGVSGFARADLAGEVDDEEARVGVGAAGVREEAPVFVPLEELVGAAPGAKAGRGTITLDALARRLAASPWFYLRWSAQRVRLAVAAATRTLRLEVYEGLAGAGAGAEALSRGLDGWDVRAVAGGQAAAGRFEQGTCALKLPECVEAGRFTVQVKRPGETEWVGLYGRAEA